MARLAHHVFFTLHDRSEASAQHLMSECRKYLTDHQGLESFDLGTRDKELNRPVNGDFDVALHMVFADRPTHDTYQVSERHQTFIAENKDNWASVVVYDSNLV
ncbi:Dabb family protein [Rubripirellula amarantea]|uniref:Stress responsive A/B Barrel Domain protein n=1 Tax=Rubripirellula amarantea TaxID=2527999 RepID=A0A5C5WG85_9BACT|nr:Dabb family protein [Rubripirellula amarantea]MDA8745685.1 Dabb family protein [Rubripirellula amarantea]TWT49119.1 Stress responsive A/B Barrel Domain protein [Rubripirellula amarantea]